MKQSIKVSGLVFLLFFSLFLLQPVAQGEQPFLTEPEITISMDFQDASLKDILKIFSMQSGLNFIASEAVQDRKITLYLENVPLEKAMDKLFKANNLSYELDKKANIFIVKDWGRPQIETETRVFYLKYASVSTSSLKEEMMNELAPTAGGEGVGDVTERGGGGGRGGGESGKWKAENEAGITNIIKKLVSEYGSVIEDFRTNSLIVTDIPSRMPVIAQTIASLDVPVPQVMLEVEMLDVSKNVVDKLGLNWSGLSGRTLSVANITRQTKFPWSSFWNPEQAHTTSASTLSITTLSLILDFLSTQTDTKYLARPRILTLNNETAEIRIATKEAIGITTTQTEAGNISIEPERTNTGVILRVTPQINLETGEITMFIYPKVAEAVAGQTFTVGNTSYTFRDPEERSTKSIVRIKDGETVILGGMIRNEFSGITQKIPILGDLPLLGFLFRHKGGGATDTPRNKQRELLVFITPHIIKDDLELTQTKKMISLPEREQDLQSGIDRQEIVSSVLTTFEKRK
ncbi:MAG: secretin and TonB N-terminal domain-containing protein [Candidatus Omnitrophica bacterium]|nr:secretin and TonB N-terminal domain-containing protein [Candidatus Omnitrophota bacterium]